MEFGIFGILNFSKLASLGVALRGVAWRGVAWRGVGSHRSPLRIQLFIRAEFQQMSSH
jgi:hypothetical protein